MGAIRDIALDLAPIAGVLVLLLGLWIGAAALSLRSPAAARRLRDDVLGRGHTARTGTARLPGPRSSDDNNADSDLGRPANGSAAKH